MTTARATTIDWLLDSDPAIRWQVMRDLTHEPAETFAAERARVAAEGWGARLLDAARPDGQWDDWPLFPTWWRELENEPQAWTGTAWALQLLHAFGVEPQHPRVQRHIALIGENTRWEHDNQPFWQGEVEECINGRTVASGSYFGVDVSPIVDLLLTQQMADGGWNCERENGATVGSFNSTIEVLEGLLEFSRASGGTAALDEAQRRGQLYLLDRHLYRRKSTGEVLDEFTEFRFPPRFHYDVLRGLDYLRDAGVEPDERVDDALALVRSKQSPDGTWPLEATQPGRIHFPLDDGDGLPSRWNTLRALRVLEWAERHGR